jgi:hypothetical protein
MDPLVFGVSLANTLWCMHRHDWKWAKPGLLATVFGFQQNTVTDVIDYPATLFVAATAGAAAGHFVSAAIQYLPPVVLSAGLGIVLTEAIRLGSRVRQPSISPEERPKVQTPPSTPPRPLETIPAVIQAALEPDSDDEEDYSDMPPLIDVPPPCTPSDSDDDMPPLVELPPKPKLSIEIVPFDEARELQATFKRTMTDIDMEAVD